MGCPPGQLKKRGHYGEVAVGGSTVIFGPLPLIQIPFSTE